MYLGRFGLGKTLDAATFRPVNRPRLAEQNARMHLDPSYTTGYSFGRHSFLALYGFDG